MLLNENLQIIQYKPGPTVGVSDLLLNSARTVRDSGDPLLSNWTGNGRDLEK